jgi:hypothetical protein
MSEPFHRAINTDGMSDQEIFDISLAHMRSQGKPAFDGTRCQYRYRNPQGEMLMCAAGPFVEDGQPNCTIADVHSIHKGTSKGGYYLMQRLQLAHDTAVDGIGHHATADRMLTVSPNWLTEEWLLRVEAECRQIAIDFDLKYCPPGEECK